VPALDYLKPISRDCHYDSEEKNLSWCCCAPLIVGELHHRTKEGFALLVAAAFSVPEALAQQAPLVGAAAFADWRGGKPGVRAG
jgi:hypothetical protein